MNVSVSNLITLEVETTTRIIEKNNLYVILTFSCL